MSLEIAVERLYESGWMPTPGRLTQRLDDGRAYPATADVRTEFESAGYRLAIRYIALFDCHRAEWTSAGGRVEGYCVGRTEAEAAVYALAQLTASRSGLATAVS